MTQSASTKTSTAKSTAAKAPKKAPAKKAASSKAKASTTKPKSATASKTKSKSAAKPKVKKGKWESRAVLRTVEAGNSVDCMVCGERIKFRAKIRQYQAICNVYEKGKWSHVEHFHDECYVEAGQPFGKPVE